MATRKRKKRRNPSAKARARLDRALKALGVKPVRSAKDLHFGTPAMADDILRAAKPFRTPK